MNSEITNGPSVDDGTESNADTKLPEVKDGPDAPVQESLVSDTCQEKFQEGGFEFSVEVESTKPESQSFEREIDVGSPTPKDDPTEAEKVQTMPDNQSGTILTVAEESDPAVDIGVEEKHEEAIVSVVQEQVIPGEHENVELSAETKVESSPPEIQQAVQVKLESQEDSERPEALVTPAQHGASTESYFAAEPEPSLVLKTEPATEVTPTPEDGEVTQPSQPKLDASTEETIENQASTKLPSEEKIHSKKKLFHFKLKPFKKNKSETGKADDKLSNASSTNNFKANVRTIFGTLRRTVSQKAKGKSRDNRANVVARPPRPPPVAGHQLRKPVSVDALDQQSLASTTEPSAQGTPELSRKQRIKKAFADFSAAMHTGTVGYATRAENGAATIEEERIRPIRAQRGTPLNANSPSPTTYSRSGLPPKPPRPQSPPILSPLDYQPYNESPEHSQLLAQRMAMMDSIDPGSHDGTNNPPRPYSAGRLQRDYAALVRERVLSLRAEPGAQSPPSTAGMHTMKPRPRTENYVCSQTIKLPKFPLKIKRRKTVPPRATTLDRPPSRGLSDYHDFHSGDYVTVSQVGVVQASAPRGVMPHPFYQNGPHNVPPRQLTSLRSLGANPAIQQQTYTMESFRKGRLQAGARPLTTYTAQEGKPVTLPYISDALKHTTESNDGVNSSDSLIGKAIRLSQPFFSNWNHYPNESAEKLAEIFKAELGEFLKVCICLRSVDLQGQFSPFHYPLPSFDARMWRKCATVTDWAQLLIVNEAEWDTDYVHLDPVSAMNHHVVYPEISIDSMLTNWLDCEHAACKSTHLYKNPPGSNGSNALFHSINMASDLESILQIKPYEEDTKNKLFLACIRLAVLLTYSHCTSTFEKCKSNPGSDLKNTLIVSSTSNCLVLFRVQASNTTEQENNGSQHQQVNNEADQKPENAEVNTDEGKEEGTNESDQNGEEKQTNDNEKVVEEKRDDQKGFVATVYPEQSELKEAINSLIEVVYKLTSECTTESNSLPDLLKSVAPPDWIALLVARIFVSK